MMENDEYLSLTEKGEKAMYLALKASIEGWSKEKFDEEIKKEWNKIIGKSEESVIR